MNANAEIKIKIKTICLGAGQFCQRKLFRTGAALTVATLMLAIAAATTAATAQTFTTVYSFYSTHNESDLYPTGADPLYALTQGRDGNLYGITAYGGANGNEGGNGVIFKLNPGGHLTVLSTFFTPGVNDGFNPNGGLTLGTDWNLYGVTGNNYNCNLDCGTFYKVTPSGSVDVFEPFNSTYELPYGPPIQGTDGNYYGLIPTVDEPSYMSPVYKITPSGSLSVIGTAPGGPARLPLVLGTDGNLYGVTVGPETTGPYAPAIFRMTPQGAVTNFYTFFGFKADQVTVGGLIQGNDGSFYGTISPTYSGDLPPTYPDGVAFKITPQGTFSVLHDFSQPPSNGQPAGGLLQASDGNFYGVTTSYLGGSPGVIFQLTPTGGYSIL